MSEAPRLRLYNYWRSSASWRVRLGLHLKGLPFEYVPVHLVREGGEQHTEAYRARNPLAQVPTLEVTHAGGRVEALTQSLAILAYLDAAFPHTPRLLPADPVALGHAWQLAEVINAGIQPLQNLATQAYVRDTLHGDAAAFTQHFVAKGIAGLEALAAQTAGTYLVGDAVTVADCCLVPQLYACRRFKIALDACPTLLAVEARLAALDAVRAAHADAQPDANT